VGISWEIVCLIFNELRLFLGSSWEFGGNFVGIWWEFGGKLFEELVGIYTGFIRAYTQYQT
jgi:hypothetical protein